jgi:hypothetical protein
MKARTYLTFTYDPPLWPLVDAWAERSRLVMDETGEMYRLFRKPGFINCPVLFEITQSDAQVTIQAWAAPFLQGGGWLPAEMELGSGDFTAILPRRNGRKILNQLLAELGQPLIK